MESTPASETAATEHTSRHGRREKRGKSMEQAESSAPPCPLCGCVLAQTHHLMQQATSHSVCMSVWMVESLHALFQRHDTLPHKRALPTSHRPRPLCTSNTHARHRFVCTASTQAAADRAAQMHLEMPHTARCGCGCENAYIQLGSAVISPQGHTFVRWRAPIHLASTGKIVVPFEVSWSRILCNVLIGSA